MSNQLKAFDDYIVHMLSQRAIMRAQLCAYVQPTVAHSPSLNDLKTKEEEMTEFHTERQALQRDLNKSYRDHYHDLSDRYHMTRYYPTTPKEFKDMLAAGEHDEMTDKEMTALWSDPSSAFVFRKGKRDDEGFKSATKKLDDALRAHELKVATHPPVDAHKDVEKFRTATFH